MGLESHIVDLLQVREGAITEAASSRPQQTREHPDAEPPDTPVMSRESPSVSPMQAAGVPVTSVTHWMETGKYFYFTKDSWIQEAGFEPGKYCQYKVQQWRNGEKLWEGLVIVWDNPVSGGRTTPTHGRRVTGAASGQWQVNDMIRCVQAADVVVTGVKHWVHPSGKYFSFDQDNWMDACGKPPVSKRGAAKHHVQQWRNGEKIWEGVVAVWDKKFTDGRDDAIRGCRDDGPLAGQWKAKDVIRLQAAPHHLEVDAAETPRLVTEAQLALREASG